MKVKISGFGAFNYLLVLTMMALLGGGLALDNSKLLVAGGVFALIGIYAALGLRQ